VLHFNTLARGDPDIQINLTSLETRRIVLPDAENRIFIHLDTMPDVTEWRTGGQKWSSY